MQRKDEYLSTRKTLHTGIHTQTFYNNLLSQRVSWKHFISLHHIFVKCSRSMLINKMHHICWLDLLIGCPGSAVFYQQVTDFLICSNRPPSLPHNTLTVFLLGSECKAITHWRVCLNHTEWLWILNVGLGPTEEQAHGRDSLSWVLILFFILNCSLFVCWVFFMRTVQTTHC